MSAPGKVAYEKANQFNDAIEELEANAGCVDYYAQGYQTGIETLKVELDKKFEEIGYEDARNILDEVFYKLGQ